MVRQRGYWTRPTSRTYMYNLDVGEHYYSPMTSYLSTERGSRGETPGALTFDERLGKIFFLFMKQDNSCFAMVLAYYQYRQLILNYLSTSWI